jgi:hypothetical protein
MGESMDIFELSALAVKHYEAHKPRRSLPHGWAKLICTDGSNCLFVHSSYDPLPGQYVFKLETRSFETYCELYKFTPVG